MSTPTTEAGRRLPNAAATLHAYPMAERVAFLHDTAIAIEHEKAAAALDEVERRVRLLDPTAYEEDMQRTVLAIIREVREAEDA